MSCLKVYLFNLHLVLHDRVLRGQTDEADAVGVDEDALVAAAALVRLLSVIVASEVPLLERGQRKLSVVGRPWDAVLDRRDGGDRGGHT